MRWLAVAAVLLTAAVLWVAWAVSTENDPAIDAGSPPSLHDDRTVIMVEDGWVVAEADAWIDEHWDRLVTYTDACLAVQYLAGFSYHDSVVECDPYSGPEYDGLGKYLGEFVAEIAASLSDPTTTTSTAPALTPEESCLSSNAGYTDTSKDAVWASWASGRCHWLPRCGYVEQSWGYDWQCKSLSDPGLTFTAKIVVDPPDRSCIDILPEYKDAYGCVAGWDY